MPRHSHTRWTAALLAGTLGGAACRASAAAFARRRSRRRGGDLMSKAKSSRASGASAASRKTADADGENSRARNATALSIHIGLNGVSGDAYGGWTGPLAACEFDANDMAAIAKDKGMKPTVLLTKKATRANVLAAMRGAAKTL